MYITCTLSIFKEFIIFKYVNIVLFIKLRDEQALYLMLIMNNFFKENLFW